MKLIQKKDFADPILTTTTEKLIKELGNTKELQLHKGNIYIKTFHTQL